METDHEEKASRQRDRVQGAGILGREPRQPLRRCQLSSNLNEEREGATWIPGGMCLGISGERTASVNSLRSEDPCKKNTEARAAGTRTAKGGTAGDELREGAGQDLRPPGDRRDLGSDPEWKGNRSRAVSRDGCDLTPASNRILQVLCRE